MWVLSSGGEEKCVTTQFHFWSRISNVIVKSNGNSQWKELTQCGRIWLLLWLWCFTVSQQPRRTRLVNWGFMSRRNNRWSNGELKWSLGVLPRWAGTTGADTYSYIFDQLLLLLSCSKLNKNWALRRHSLEAAGEQLGWILGSPTNWK